ncbi:ORF60 [Ovine gammaherpesvirus 2]|uniref:ribonucleoside-diphosphate reductase n=1 Tax=Ovine gammaherpesvirus 2 TaxID=10398 RepID=Q2VSI1_9GAMA|nr:ORF60 [Ovine gammaherpesvirus 2]AAX58095.1 ORF60 [Ovine gammaherpesvirus 2]ABB22279.1 ribonucleotide-reductase small subunit-like protein [Ovine gammaherpesvirus 2]WOZ69505.1 ORF60 ribonucleotide-reductase small subunit-like protein [Ovine gammaherpesvirus 2]
MEFIKKYLYVCDHRGFFDLTQETFQNRWFPAQINLTADVKCLGSLSEKEVAFYKYLFTFLGMAETLVNFNIDELVAGFEIHDVKHYYCEQMAMECVHGKVYFNILNMLFKNNIAETRAFAESVLEDEPLRKKLQWLEGKIKTAESAAEKVLIFYLIEGIFFISSFYCIGLLRVKGVMPGVCMANDYISRDELLHTRAAALLYNTVIPQEGKPSEAWIIDLFKEAVSIEDEFIRAKSGEVGFVNVADIRRFLEATADRLLNSIGLPVHFKSEPPKSCPLTYTGCIKNVSFFERESTEYSTFIINDL